MKKLTDAEWKKNLEFFKKYNVSEDPDFNEKRNQEIINRTIRKNEAKRKQMQRDFREGTKDKIGLGERIDMMASYLKSDTTKPVEKYLGKRLMAKMRADQIINQLKEVILKK